MSTLKIKNMKKNIISRIVVSLHSYTGEIEGVKKSTIFFITICFFTTTAFTQPKFSSETNKFIDCNDPVTVFKNALLIDGTGNAPKPHQTIIISIQNF
jgi:hypothetical protein